MPAAGKPPGSGLRAVVALAATSPTITLAGSHVAKLFAMFGPLPWMLARFSAAEMAVYESCLTLSVLSLIFASVITPTFTRILIYELTAEHTGRTDREDGGPRNTTRLIRTLLTASAFVSLLLFGTFLAAGAVLLREPISQLVFPAHGWLAWTALSISTCCTVFGLAFVSFLWANQELPLQRSVEGVFFVLGGVLTIIVLRLGGGLLSVCLAMSLMPVPCVLAQWRMCSLRRPGDFAASGIGKYTPEIFREIWPPAWKSGMGVALGFGVFKIAALICSQGADVAGAASFLFSLRLLDAIDSFARLPITGNVPRMVQLYSLGRREELLQLTRRAMLTTYLTFTAGMAAAGVALPYLLERFHAPFGAPSRWIWIGSGLGLLLVRAGASHLQLYSVTNDIVWHIANGGSGVLLLLTLFAAIPFFAERTAAYPWALIGSTLAFYLPYCMRLSYREFGIRGWRFERGALIPGLALFGAGAAITFAVM